MSLEIVLAMLTLLSPMALLAALSFSPPKRPQPWEAPVRWVSLVFATWALFFAWTGAGSWNLIVGCGLTAWCLGCLSLWMWRWRIRREGGDDGHGGGGDDDGGDGPDWDDFDRLRRQWDSRQPALH